MLTIEDEPTIRFALSRRLGKERGVTINDIQIAAHPDCIRVGLLLSVDGRVLVKSLFELPTEFELGHIHAEADEIAEQVKKARMDSVAWSDREVTPETALKGTGMRGRWARYG